MREIVIAVDGSPEGWFAANVGLDVAKAHGATATFLHASSETHSRLVATDLELPNRQDDLAAADPILGKAVEQATKAGVKCRIELSRGETSREIVTEILGLAEELGADLVVSGSRGRGAVVQSVLGSVSRALLRDAAIPTLVVKVPHARG